MNVAFETSKLCKLPNISVQAYGSSRLGLDLELPRFPGGPH
jgi:hypothetical protein